MGTGRVVFPRVGTVGMATMATPGAALPRPVLQAVPSPCINICRMDEVSGLCEGCTRTLDEIAAWSTLDDDTKRAVIAALPARRAAIADPFGDAPP